MGEPVTSSPARWATPSQGIVQREVVPAGGRWSARLEAGDRLRIVDLHGQQAVDFLCFAADLPLDRYNAANTVKLAKTIYIGKGVVLYSERARPLIRVVEDTCGHHDTLAGCCSAEINEVRYGVKNTPSCRANFIAELQRWGMSQSDIVANVNFFMNMPVEADGSVAIGPCISKAGDYVELVAEMPVIVVLSNCPQRHNPCSGFEPTPIEVIITR
jgi:urea carboxylase-associated protein 1